MSSQTLPVRIQHATLRSLHTVAAMSEQYYGPWQYTEPDLCKLTQDREMPGRVYVAKTQCRKLVGYLIFVYCREIRAFDIRQIGVHPDYRRRGVATQLLESLRRLQSKKPGGVIGHLVPAGQVVLQDWLRARGFTLAHVTRGHFNNEDGFYFRQAGHPQLVQCYD